MRRLSLVMLGVIVVLAHSASAQTQTDPERWVGTWKMNLSKSKYQVGSLPQSRTLKFEKVTGGLKVTSNLLDVDGPVHLEFTAKYDGKDVVMYGPVAGVTIAMKRIDANTLETEQKNNGVSTVVSRFVVSSDGKTMTA